MITGGSSGIGLASAQRFVEEGADAFITGRRQSELDKAKALIGEGVTTVAADSTKCTPGPAVRDGPRRQGRLDILLANSAPVELEELGKSPRRTSTPPSTLTPGQPVTVQKALPLMREGG